MKKINMSAECQFLKDIESEPNYNGVPLGIYNLIVTKGALKLWNKEIIGVKTRNLRLLDVRKYFGITGNAKELYNKLKIILEIVQNPKNVKALD